MRFDISGRRTVRVQIVLQSILKGPPTFPREPLFLVQPLAGAALSLACCYPPPVCQLSPVWTRKPHSQLCSKRRSRKRLEGRRRKLKRRCRRCRRSRKGWGVLQDAVDAGTVTQGPGIEAGAGCCAAELGRRSSRGSARTCRRNRAVRWVGPAGTPGRLVVVDDSDVEDQPDIHDIGSASTATASCRTP